LQQMKDPKTGEIIPVAAPQPEENRRASRRDRIKASELGK